MVHRIENAIVQDGELRLTGLPFRNGEHVQVQVAPVPSPSRVPVQEARRILRGSVVHFDAPLDPVIPVDDWEMLW
jgi:hypothetical protein